MLKAKTLLKNGLLQKFNILFPVCVCVCVWERESMSVCVCVCVGEREGRE